MRLVAEQRTHERLDGAEQVGEGDATVDHQRFDLVEHRRVARRRRLVAVGAAGSHHVDRWLHVLHGADLHRRRVGAQQDLLGLAQLDVERVLHGAGRVRGRHVERLEVVPVVLDLGAFHDAVAHAHEDVFELALHLRDQVEVPTGATVPADGEVDARPVAPTPRRPPRAPCAWRRRARRCGPCRRPTALPAAGRSPGSRSLIASLACCIGEPRPVSARSATARSSSVAASLIAASETSRRASSSESVMRRPPPGPLARRLEAEHDARHRHVERLGGPVHRHRDPPVEMGVEVGRQAVRLVPEHDRGRVGRSRPRRTACRRGRRRPTAAGPAAPTRRAPPPPTTPPARELRRSRRRRRERLWDCRHRPIRYSARLPRPPTLPRSATACPRCRDRRRRHRRAPDRRMPARRRPGTAWARPRAPVAGVTVEPSRSSTPSLRRCTSRPAARIRATRAANATSAFGPRNTASSGAPRSSADSNARGPSTTNAWSACRAFGIVQQRTQPLDRSAPRAQISAHGSFAAGPLGPRLTAAQGTCAAAARLWASRIAVAPREGRVRQLRGLPSRRTRARRTRRRRGPRGRRGSCGRRRSRRPSARRRSASTTCRAGGTRR